MRPVIAWHTGFVDPADIILAPPGVGIPIQGDPADALRILGPLPSGFDVIGFIADTMTWPWPTRSCRTRPYDREWDR